MQSEKTELLKYEFDIETKRAQSYFDLMYRILNFSFAALTALIALTGALFNMK